MMCPECGSNKFNVYSTQPEEKNTKVQYRKCLDCGNKGKTVISAPNFTNSSKQGVDLVTKQLNNNT